MGTSMETTQLSVPFLVWGWTELGAVGLECSRADKSWWRWYQVKDTEHSDALYKMLFLREEMHSFTAFLKYRLIHQAFWRLSLPLAPSLSKRQMLNNNPYDSSCWEKIGKIKGKINPLNRSFLSLFILGLHPSKDGGGKALESLPKYPSPRIQSHTGTLQALKNFKSSFDNPGKEE